MVKNYMEILVDEILKDSIKKNKSFVKCGCEECIDNIKAIALNNIKPFYVTCKVGEVYGTYNNKIVQNRADIAVEISKAADIVGEKPKHAVGQPNE